MSAVRRLAPLVLAVAVLPLAAPTVAAAGIVVTSLGTATADDGLCTLREAMAAAESDTASGATPGECAAGAGADVVTFAVAGTITLPEKVRVATEVVVDGGGAITIAGAGIDSLVLVEASGDVTLRGLTLTGGQASYSGAVYNAGTLLVEDCAIEGNAADTAGGGIYNQSSGTLTVRDSTIAGNYGASGGGIYSAGGTVTVTGSTISGNTAIDGAGVYAWAGTLALGNVTVAGNAASGGSGAIAVPSAGVAVTLANVTVTGNASSSGGALAVTPGATLAVANSIVAGNTGADGGASIDTAVANLVGVDVAGILAPAGLADNGGPTETVRLLATASDAIDQGDAATCAGPLVGGVDQRGLARPSGGGCDIGAVERDGQAPTMTSAPRLVLVEGAALAGSAARARLTWAASDAAGSGVSTYLVERRVNGGAFTALASPDSARLDVRLPKGERVEFRVTPTDHDGNTGSPLTSSAATASLTQQSYGGITYLGRWATRTDAAASGDSVRTSTRKGASARFLFTGRGIAFVATEAPTRGKAKIYINGTLVDRIDLGRATRHKVQAWTKTWTGSATRTIKIVVVGTSGRPRIDVDAFVVLR